MQRINPNEIASSDISNIILCLILYNTRILQFLNASAHQGQFNFSCVWTSKQAQFGRARGTQNPLKTSEIRRKSNTNKILIPYILTRNTMTGVFTRTCWDYLSFRKYRMFQILFCQMVHLPDGPWISTDVSTNFPQTVGLDEFDCCTRQRALLITLSSYDLFIILGLYRRYRFQDELGKDNSVLEQREQKLCSLFQVSHEILENA